MYSTQGVVLSAVPYSEADMLVSFYTKDFGKLLVRARGVRNMRTKQGAFLHSPSVLYISFVMGRAGFVLSGIKSIEDYNTIGADFHARGYLTSFLSLCDQLLYEEQQDPALWRLLRSAFIEIDSCLNQTSKARLRLWRQEKVLLLRLLSVLGFMKNGFKNDGFVNPQHFDRYIQTLLQNKFERPVSFFGLTLKNL